MLDSLSVFIVVLKRLFFFFGFFPVLDVFSYFFIVLVLSLFFFRVLLSLLGKEIPLGSFRVTSFLELLDDFALGFLSLATSLLRFLLWLLYGFFPLFSLVLFLIVVPIIIFTVISIVILLVALVISLSGFIC